MDTKTLNLSELEEILKSNNLVLVDFFTDWCGPCKMFAPIIESVAEKYKNSVKVVKINVDENPELSEAYDIKCVPTLLVFKEGKLTDKSAGVVTLSRCVNLIEKRLKEKKN